MILILTKEQAHVTRSVKCYLINRHINYNFLTYAKAETYDLTVLLW